MKFIFESVEKPSGWPLNVEIKIRWTTNLILLLYDQRSDCTLYSVHKSFLYMSSLGIMSYQLIVDCYLGFSHFNN